MSNVAPSPVAPHDSPVAVRPEEIAHRVGTHEPVVLIDVRTPIEFAQVHARGAVNVPLDRFDPHVLRQQYPDDLIACICKSGKRGGQALQRLRAAGVMNSVNVTGGTDAWTAAALPVERDHRVISIERQVRIGAGAIVLVGLALGRYVHPAFLLLSAFVGAGLVFAGVTDWCGMGLLLAKMPWNQSGSKQNGGGASCAK